MRRRQRRVGDALRAREQAHRPCARAGPRPARRRAVAARRHAPRPRWLGGRLPGGGRARGCAAGAGGAGACGPHARRRRRRLLARPPRRSLGLVRRPRGDSRGTRPARYGSAARRDRRRLDGRLRRARPRAAHLSALLRRRSSLARALADGRRDTGGRVRRRRGLRAPRRARRRAAAPRPLRPDSRLARRRRARLLPGGDRGAGGLAAECRAARVARRPQPGHTRAHLDEYLAFYVDACGRA
jgi:hypothetical protein